jgi:WD40 repeat protein
MMKSFRKMFEPGALLLAIVMFSAGWGADAGAEEKAEVFVQLGHTNMVSSVAISPDSRYALSGSHDFTLKLWDVNSGREIRTFQGHSGFVNSVVFSPDTMYALSGSFDKTLKLWDVSNGREIRTFEGHKGPVTSVAFSPDGRYALSGGGDLKLWDIKTGGEVRTFEGSFGSVSSVAFSPDGRYALSGSTRNPLKLWDVNTGREIRTFQAHSKGVKSVAISPDGRYALSGSYDPLNKDYSLRLWDIDTGNEIRTFLGHKGRVSSVAISPDGKYVLSGSQDNTLKLWDINTGNEIRTIQGFSTCAVFSPDGRYVLSGTVDNYLYTLKLWDVRTGKEIRAFQGNSGAVSSVALSPDGRHALFNGGGYSNLWDISTGKGIRTIQNVVGPVAFSPDGRNALLGSLRGTFKLWDMGTTRELRTFKGHSSAVTSVAFSPDGKYVLSGSWDKTLKLWDIDSGREIRTFQGHSGFVNSVAFSPDGRYALSGSYDNTLKLWDTASGKEIRAFQGHSGFVNSVAFSPDGRYALSGSWDKTLKLWDIDSGKVIRSYKGHAGAVNSVVFSSDGRYALSGSADHYLKLWDINTGDEVRTFQGHSGAVNSVVFTPDGRYVVSGGNDTTRLWNIKTGKELAQFFSFADDEWITITSEGYYSSSQNGHKYLNIRLGKISAYGIDQFYDVFYRPDIVQAKLKGEDISSMISITIDDAIRNPPPSVKFTTVPTNTSDAIAKVCYQASNTGGGIGEVRLFQNGKLVKSDGFYRETVAKTSTPEKRKLAMNSRAIQEDLRSLVVKEKEKPLFMEAKPKGETFEECVDIEAIPGDNEISVTAFNAQNTIQSYLQTASFTSARPAEEPHLYILAVGIDKYRDSSANLKYAAKDARDFIAKLPAKAASIYKPENIHVTSLSDSQAGKAGIIGTIEQLSRKVKQGDGFIFFNASHGVLLQNQYYIVTADFDGDLSMTKSLISSNEIVEISKKIKSLSQLFIFDTCHAGGIDNIVSGLYDARMSVMAKKMGLHIYASAGSVQSAMDGYQGNGLYTHTLLQGIENGKEVDKEKEGKVTFKNLGLYSKDKTTEISTKLGHPQTPFIINFGRDNPLFVVQ